MRTAHVEVDISDRLSMTHMQPKKVYEKIPRELRPYYSAVFFRRNSVLTINTPYMSSVREPGSKLTCARVDALRFRCNVTTSHTHGINEARIDREFLIAEFTGASLKVRVAEIGFYYAL